MMKRVAYSASLVVLVTTFILCTSQCCKPCDENAKTPVVTPSNNGSFIAKFIEPKSPQNKEILDAVKKDVEKVIALLNERLALPHDISVIFSDDPKGPLYSPGVLTGFSVAGEKGRLIAFPYEFVEHIGDVLVFGGFEGKELNEAVVDSTLFALVHEMSHALIDVFELPVLGRDEDAADSGSAIFLTSLEDGAQIVHNAVQFWRLRGQALDLHDLSFADEHGLDTQRAYNLVCWIYGRSVTKNAFLEHELPTSRRARCPMEYSQLARSWDKVLKEHLRKKL